MDDEEKELYNKLSIFTFGISLDVLRLYFEIKILDKEEFFFFLDRCKHLLFHALNSTVSCCKCRNGSILNSRIPLNRDQFNLLFDIENSTSQCLHNKTVKNCLCKYSASRSVKVDSLDISLLYKIVKTCCTSIHGNPQWIKDVKDTRNFLAHKNIHQLTKDEYDTWLTTVENATLDLAKIVSSTFLKMTQKQITDFKKDKLSSNTVKDILASSNDEVCKRLEPLMRNLVIQESKSMSRDIKDHIEKHTDKLSIDIKELIFEVRPQICEQLPSQKITEESGETGYATSTHQRAQPQRTQSENENKRIVEWKLATPDTWNVSEMKTTLQNLSCLFKPCFEIEFVYIGSLVIRTIVPEHTLSNYSDFKSAVRLFLAEIVEACQLDTDTPTVVKVDLNIFTEIPPTEISTNVKKEHKKSTLTSPCHYCKEELVCDNCTTHGRIKLPVFTETPPEWTECDYSSEYGSSTDINWTADAVKRGGNEKKVQTGRSRYPHDPYHSFIHSGSSKHLDYLDDAVTWDGYEKKVETEGIPRPHLRFFRAGSSKHLDYLDDAVTWDGYEKKVETEGIPRPHLRFVRADAGTCLDDLNDSVSCDVCGKTFETEIILRIHHSRFHKENIIKPEIIKEYDPYHRSLSGPMDRSTRRGKLRSIFSLRKPKGHHDVTKSYSDSVACNVCEKMFKTESDRRNHHLHFHTGYSDSVACNVCEKMFKTESDRRNHHLHFHTGYSDSVACNVCGEMFKTASARRNHYLDLHTGYSDSVACNVCGEMFKTESARRNHHLDFHAGSTIDSDSVTCNVCGKMLKTESARRTHHLNFHTGYSYSVACNVCGEMLKTESARRNHHLDFHAVSTIDSDSVTCNVCGKMFKTESARRTHHLNFHTGSTIDSDSVTCNVCGKMFKTESARRTHHLNFHTGSTIDSDSVTCNFCGKMFKTESARRTHHLDCHTDDSMIDKEIGKIEHFSPIRLEHDTRVPKSTDILPRWDMKDKDDSKSSTEKH